VRNVCCFRRQRLSEYNLHDNNRKNGNWTHNSDFAKQDGDVMRILVDQNPKELPNQVRNADRRLRDYRFINPGERFVCPVSTTTADDIRERTHQDRPKSLQRDSGHDRQQRPACSDETREPSGRLIAGTLSSSSARTSHRSGTRKASTCAIPIITVPLHRATVSPSRLWSDATQFVPNHTL
jgi:hypothetical protein